MNRINAVQASYTQTAIKIKRLLDEGVSKHEIARIMGINRSNVQKYIKEYDIIEKQDTSTSGLSKEEIEKRRKVLLTIQSEQKDEEL